MDDNVYYFTNVLNIFDTHNFFLLGMKENGKNSIKKEN